MSKYHDAADVLKRQAVKYKSLMDAAAALEEVGSLDQAATECKAQLAAARADLDFVYVQLDASKKELAEHKDKVKTVKKLDQAKSDEILQSANDDAKAIVDQATEMAEQIKASATEEARAYLQASQASADALSEQKRTLEQQISANLDTLAAQKTEAEDLEKRIAKAQASIAKLLG